jgi:hypothetical protein
MAGDQGARIVISGKGRLDAEVVAVGYKARAEKIVSAAGAALDAKGLEEVHEKLDALLAALNQHGDKLPFPKPVFVLAERIAGELSGAKPDRLTLRSFLGAIAEEAKSVGEIAAAALSLKDLVGAIF